MLAQQNLMEEGFEDKLPFSGPVINKIEHETSRIKNLVLQLRVNKRKQLHESAGTPFHIQNECEISNIEPVSEKLQRNSFQFDLPADSGVRKNAFTMVPIGLKAKSSDKEIGDKGLKYRPRGAINGRDDIRIRNLSDLHKKIGVGKEKNQKDNSSEKDKDNIESALLKFDQLQNPQSPLQSFLQSQSRFNLTNKNKKSISNVPHSLNKSRFRKQSQSPKKTSLTFQFPKKNLPPQNLLLDPKQLLQYLQKYPSTKLPTSDCSPSKIYQFFVSISSHFDIESEFNEPLIKRYRNCIYFGHKVPENGTYLGFVWYFRKALYYGEFQRGRKNGYGVQIDLEEEGNQCVWRGTFTNGKKTGYFEVISPKLEYNGSLVNSYFDGQGMLRTKGHSVYKGAFQAGMKHGYGVEHFENKKSLVYRGEYVENRFDGKGQLEGPNYFYKGQFRNNRTHGQGYERTEDFEYEGQFKNGKRSGEGTLKLKNGEQYTGIFSNGELVQEFNPKQGYKNGDQTQRSPQIPNQYTKSIKIQSQNKYHQQSSLAPSSLLPQQQKIHPPKSLRQQSLRHQSQQRRQQKLHLHQPSSQTMRLTNTNNVDVRTYSSRIVPLEKHLSKRLSSLYEENQNQQATIDNVIRYRGNQRTMDNQNGGTGLFKLQEVRNHQMRDMFDRATNGNRDNNYKRPTDAEDQNDEDQPLDIKVIPRE